jgi:hypothetical protein
LGDDENDDDDDDDDEKAAITSLPTDSLTKYVSPIVSKRRLNIFYMIIH